MTVHVAIAPPNQPPEAYLEGGTVLENAANGTEIGRLFLIDPENDALSVTLVDPFGQPVLSGPFALVYDAEAGNYRLVVRDRTQFDFEATGGQLSFRVKIADATHEVFRDFTVLVADVNERPTDILLSHTSVEENSANGALVANLSGFDPDAGDTLSYRIKDPAASLFEIVRNADGIHELRVKDGSKLDYEVDEDKKVEVTVIATDRNGLSFEKMLSLDIVDVNEAPTDIIMSDNWVYELADRNTVVCQLSTLDPDSDDAFTYTLLDDAGGRFWIDGDVVKVAHGVAIDFEQRRSHDIKVLAVDGNGATVEKILSIAVRNVGLESTASALATGDMEGNDIIKGGIGADFLAMGGGDDVVYGRGGDDTLIGGEGNDIFVFDGNINSTYQAIVADYVVGEDKIHFKAQTISLPPTAAGVPLAADRFFEGSQASTTLHRIGYDSATGKLYLDRDGSGTTYAPIEIATLWGQPIISVNDFFIIA